jgi:hypothetical protein
MKKFMKKKTPKLTRPLSLEWRDCFGLGIKWDAPSSLGIGLDFELGLWRLHTMTVQVKRPWEFMTKGLEFGLDLWRLPTVPNRKAHNHVFYWLCIFNPFL